jgi:hypothetical protein
MFNHTRSHE